MKQLPVVGVALILATALPVGASAQKCGVLANWLDLCKAAREAGAEAARELALGAQNTADIAFSAINFWPWLIQKYHTGTAEEKARARELVSKTFGVQEIEGTTPFVVTVSFTGIDTKKTPLRVAMLADYAGPNVVRKVEDGNTFDFNFVAIRGAVPAVRTDYREYLDNVDTLRARVRNTIREMVRSGNIGWQGLKIGTRGDVYCTDPFEDGKMPSMFGNQQPACSSTIAWRKAHDGAEHLLNAIMLTVDDKIDRRAARSSASFAYQGYRYITFLLPRSDVDGAPQMQMSFTIHQAGKPEKPLPTFSDDWEITYSDIKRRPILPSSRKEHGGEYYAITVDLGSR